MWSRRTLVRAMAGMAIGALIAVAGVTSGPARGAPAAAGNTLSLPDPVGDVKGVPGLDISSVTVSDDGQLATLTVTTAEPLPDYGIVLVAIDADRNTATGQLGEDELIGAALQPGQFASVFGRWDGSAWQAFEPAGSDVDVSDNTVTFRLARPDVLGDGEFDFWVAAMMVDPNGTALSQDYAPDSGTATYAFASATPAPTVKTTETAPQLSFGAVRVAPSPVRAGRHETVTFAVHAGPGVSVGPANGMTVKVTLGGRPLAHTTRWSGSSVVVGMTLPKTARGKRLVVSVSLGGSWIRTVSYVVR